MQVRPVISLLLALGAGLAPDVAGASRVCACSTPPLRERVDRADVAFTGYAVRQEAGGTLVRVDRVVKAGTVNPVEPGTQVWVENTRPTSGEPGGEPCALPLPVNDDVGVIAAYDESFAFEGNRCLSASASELVELSRVQTAFPWAAAVLVGVSAGAVVLVSRRRQWAVSSGSS